MDYVTVRELREQSGKVWQRIEAGEEFVVTRNGKPFAVLLHTEPSDVEATLRAHRAARLSRAVAHLQAQAGESRADAMLEAEIDAEIRASHVDAALQALAALNPFSGIEVEQWQRGVRADRALSGRD